MCRASTRRALSIRTERHDGWRDSAVKLSRGPANARARARDVSEARIALRRASRFESEQSDGCVCVCVSVMGVG